MNYGAGIGSFADGFMAGNNMRKGRGITPDDIQQQVQEADINSQSQVKPAFTGSDSMSQVSQEAQRQQELAQQRAAQSQNSGSGQSQGMSPGVGLGIAKSFMGGGSAAGAGAGTGAGGAAAGGSSASGGLGGAAAAAGPWAALAAIIGVNEYNAKKGGFRAEDDKQYTMDLFDGKVASQDINGRWAPKLFGNNDRMGLGADMKAAGEASHLDLNSTIDNLKKGTVGKLLKKIF